MMISNGGGGGAAAGGLAAPVVVTVTVIIESRNARETLQFLMKVSNNQFALYYGHCPSYHFYPIQNSGNILVSSSSGGRTE